MKIIREIKKPILKSRTLRLKANSSSMAASVA
jgi:hypothetical protein